MSEVAQLLAELIRFDTRNPGGDELALARFVETQLQRRSPDVLRLVTVPRGSGSGAGQGAYVYASWGRPRWLLNAHLDTVPANAGWTGAPHEPRLEGGRVIGLGACDTKGAIAAALAAVDDVQARGAGPRDVAMLFSGDEEVGGTCARAFVEAGLPASLERVVACEPTSCKVGVRHRGILALTAELLGEGGHSSRADHMPAPIAELARLAISVDAWGKLRRETGPEGFKGMCVNVAMLEGGVAFNVIPERATLSFSLRPPPGADAAAIREELLALSARIVPGAQVITSLDNVPFATRALEGFRPILGAAVDAPIDLAFWTEAAVFSAAGLDAVVYGPGDIAQAHAADEWVTVAELEQARATFAAAFASGS